MAGLRRLPPARQQSVHHGVRDQRCIEQLRPQNRWCVSPSSIYRPRMKATRLLRKSVPLRP